MSVVDERNEYRALAECDREKPEYEAKKCPGARNLTRTITQKIHRIWNARGY
jgi:hypothetical protein